MNLSDIFNEQSRPKTMNKQPAEKLTLSNNRDSMHVHILSKVRLNRYDTKFMSNIFEKYISQGKPLSAGQNELYEKIVHKYRKQLKKLRVNYKDILALPWENGIADPNALNQKTYFQITDDDEMRLYFNFNKTHIDEVRSLVHDDAGNHLNRGADQNFGNGQRYSFEWNKAEKIWHGPFNLHLLKTLYEWCLAHKIQIDDSVKDLVAKLDSHGSKEEWTPGVRIVHGRMYINIITDRKSVV